MMKYQEPKIPRTIKKYPSINTTPGNAFKKEPIKYTGTKILGIATMHKSNAVPVFSFEEAKELKDMNS